MKLSIFSMKRTPGQAGDDSAQPDGSGLPGAPGPGPAAPAGDRSPQTGGLQNTTPLLASNTLLQLRRRILNRLYILTSLAGVALLLANLPLIIQNALWGTLAFYALMIAALMIFTFQRSLSYSLRMGMLTGILLAGGTATLMSRGLEGNGRLLLMLVPFFAAVLGGAYSRTAGVLLSVGGVLLSGALALTGVIEIQSTPPTAAGAISAWVTAVVGFALVAVTGISSFAILVDGLERSLQQQDALTRSLRVEQTGLELRVRQRTEVLERRLVQLRTAAEITRSLSRVLDLQQLLPQVCELVRERFDAYYVGVFLVEETGRAAGDMASGARYAVLAAGTGEAGQRMLAENHRLLVGGDSMIGWATANRQARIALDVGKEAVRFSNPYLPRTRSELALPILAGEVEAARERRPAARRGAAEWGSALDRLANRPQPARVLGAMTVQSEVESAFDQDDITVLQGIADGLAAAIENARLFSATQASLEEVRRVQRAYLESSWAGVQQSRGEMAYEYHAGAAAAAQPSGGAPDGGAPGEAGRLLVPIRLREQVIGSLEIEAPPGVQWTAAQQALAEAVSTQAALALENARLLEETRRQAEQEQAAAQITSRLWSSSDIDTILQTILRELGSSLRVNQGWIEIWPGEAPEEAGYVVD
ncbi:MAG: GAF domain-containing protein [Chloroflexota bacterium]